MERREGERREWKKRGRKKRGRKKRRRYNDYYDYPKDYEVSISLSLSLEEPDGRKETGEKTLQFLSHYYSHHLFGTLERGRKRERRKRDKESERDRIRERKRGSNTFHGKVSSISFHSFFHFFSLSVALSHLLQIPGSENRNRKGIKWSENENE